MAHISRAITDDGCVVVLAADTFDIVETARQYNNSTKVCTAALGRLLTGTSLMGILLKGDEDSVTVRINGGGPVGSVICASDSLGNVRGYMMDSHVDLPPKYEGKLDVGAAVGNDGFITVIKDLGMNEPTVGQVALVSGEIAEDITSYFAVSEQIPTVCGLGVLVNPDQSVAAAGGYLIQLLPTADDTIIDRIEKGLRDLPPVTTMLSSGMSTFDICKRVLPEFEVELLDESDCTYKCNCSRERVEKALISTGKEALSDMANDPVTEVKCHFCPTVYRFTSADIKDIISKI